MIKRVTHASQPAKVFILFTRYLKVTDFIPCLVTVLFLLSRKFTPSKLSPLGVLTRQQRDTAVSHPQGSCKIDSLLLSATGTGIRCGCVGKRASSDFTTAPSCIRMERHNVEFLSQEIATFRLEYEDDYQYEF